jgi:hypothetical protein
MLSKEKAQLKLLAIKQRALAQMLDRTGNAKLGTIAHDIADKLTQLSLVEVSLSDLDAELAEFP